MWQQMSRCAAWVCDLEWHSLHPIWTIKCNYPVGHPDWGQSYQDWLPPQPSLNVSSTTAVCVRSTVDKGWTAGSIGHSEVARKATGADLSYLLAWVGWILRHLNESINTAVISNSACAVSWYVISKLPKSTKVRSHGNNVRDVIIAHVISADAHTCIYTDAETTK